MDGQPRSSTGLFSADRSWLLLLLVLILPLRVWLLTNTVVTARDSIVFIEYALQLDKSNWGDVVRGEHQHPGYPFVVWLASKPVCAIRGTTPEAMQLSAQLVSLVASLFLAALMFRLGIRLWDRYVGFWGALLFQFLPGSAHHLSDGISEALFLLCVASAFLLFVRGIQTKRSLPFALGGAFAGAAYLTRPEGLIVLAAFVLFWLGYQFSARTRWPWRSWLVAGTAAVMACVLVGSVYVATTGRLSGKPNSALDHALAAPLPDEVGSVFFASVWASNFVASSNLFVQLGQTLRALAFEVGQGFHYGGCIPLLWALVFCRRRIAARPEFRMLPIYAFIHAGALVYLGVKASYVSERHVLPLVMIGSYLCVLGVVDIAAKLVGVWSFLRRTETSPFAVTRFAVLLFMPLLAVCMTKTLQPLHGNRVGNREAGIWLAQHICTGDDVVDEHKWSQYYSGMKFNGLMRPFAGEAKRYTVVTRLDRPRWRGSGRRISQQDRTDGGRARLPVARECGQRQGPHRGLRNGMQSAEGTCRRNGRGAAGQPSARVNHRARRRASRMKSPRDVRYPGSSTSPPPLRRSNSLNA